MSKRTPAQRAVSLRNLLVFNQRCTHAERVRNGAIGGMTVAKRPGHMAMLGKLSPTQYRKI